MGEKKQKIDIDVLYVELRDYCFEVLVDDTISWRGSIDGIDDSREAQFRNAIEKGRKWNE